MRQFCTNRGVEGIGNVIDVEITATGTCLCGEKITAPVTFETEKDYYEGTDAFATFKCPKCGRSFEEHIQ